MGIIFASCPALRQLFAYYHRTGTFFPSTSRPPPNTDFAFMRERVKLRDVFWIRQPPSVDIGIQPAGLPLPPPDQVGNSTTLHDGEVDKSPLNAFMAKVRGALSVPTAYGRHSSVEGADGFTMPWVRVKEKFSSVSSTGRKRRNHSILRELGSLDTMRATRLASVAESGQSLPGDLRNTESSSDAGRNYASVQPIAHYHTDAGNRISEDPALPAFIQTSK